MRLRKEGAPINSTVDFTTTFDAYRLNNNPHGAPLPSHCSIPGTSSPGAESDHNLGELRGKVLILQDFGAGAVEYGIRWASTLLAIQDGDDVPDLYSGLDAKFESLKRALEGAAEAT